MSAYHYNEDGSYTVQTNCFECHCKCGALCYVNAEGKLWKVEGDPTDPRSEGRMCPKGRAAVKILYDEHRNNYPMRRKPGTERGAGQWERITWDEAMDDIVEHIERYRKEFGPQSIVFGQGTGRGTNQWQHRLGGINGVNHSCWPGHVCLSPEMTTQFSTIGMLNFMEGADFKHTDCMVMWGGNMAWSEGALAAGELNDFRVKDRKLIVIDPCGQAPMASRADIWIRVRPGTDTALAMAFLRICMEEKLYDADFTKKWTTLPILVDAEAETPITQDMVVAGGSSEVYLVRDVNTGELVDMSDSRVTSGEVDPMLDTPVFEMTAVDGRILRVKTAWEALRGRVIDMTPQRAAEICWADAKLIYEAGKLMCESPTCAINMFQGVEENTNARYAIHAATILNGITGNIDVRGGNCWHKCYNDLMGPHLTGGFPDTHWEWKLGKQYAAHYVHSHPHGVWDAALTGKPYPVKAFINIAGNPISWSENPDRVVEALKAFDFVVTMDYFMSPTAQLSDIVLPSAHWTERDYVADEFCQEWIYAQVHAVEPLYERRSDVTFMRELGNRINPEGWPWKTDEEILDYQLEPYGLTWKELVDKHIYAAYAYEPKKYEKEGFATATGKAELYSFTFLSAGRCDPLIRYEEPAESPYSVDDATAKEFPFVLSTGRRYVNFYHSNYRGIPMLRELAREPYILINDESAAELGIKEHDKICLESPDSPHPVHMKAHLTHGMHPRVIIAPHGWWQGCPDLGLPGYPNNSANANVLISDKHYDPDLGCAGMRSSLCKVYLDK